ncbi:MAG: carotenoid biosynthesis protein [Candidatus Hodarchaeota archaeon]
MTTNTSPTISSSYNRRSLLFALLLIGPYVISYLFVSFPLQATPFVFSTLIVCSAFPTLFFFYKWLGRNKALTIFPFLVGLTYCIEGFGIITGFPYGYFYYTGILGFKLFDLVPWTVPFAFLPLLVGSFVVAKQFVRAPWKLVLLSAIFLVLVDLVLDPALVLLNIWVWITPGVYYGVPVTNYLGWFFTGLIASTILFYLLPKEKRDLAPTPVISVSLLFSVAFWSGYTLWSMLWIPFSISLILLVIMFPIIGLTSRKLNWFHYQLQSKLDS